MAEEFVFDEIFGDGGAIERDERLIAAIGNVMDGSGEELLAGAAFPEKENGGFGGGDFLQLLADGAHGGGFAHDAWETVAGSELFAQDEVLAEEFLLPGGALDKELEVVEIDRFLDEVESAFFHGGDGFVDSDLLDPEINVRYGSWYLRHLLGRYHDVRTALAAYHAGQGNVDEWIRDGGGIRFPETRHYVQTVLDAQRVYADVYGDELGG